MQINKITKITIIVLAFTTIFFAYLYFSSCVKFRNAEKIIASQQVNEKVLSFSQLFFDKVLQGTKEVSFDDRLRLENAVRALNDKEIFDSWTKFTGAKDQTQIQKNFYSLFQLLLKKITP
ncbi:MAG: hypothetical protein UR91_C0037G0002 [Candidatus Nomurabacteria bacterium GW2011_GWC2_35_8]|uniref:Uncharacterized protein n=1 Tax=Candidatus Nomurabacteria bacterium GW2011_GWC2_35_8 TaxID=1618752 RepID=A0A0G0D354_9BACT|nr:MAG: hypothetical protein UR91_C0037G0002 [Candidatus Nomurabacteria bacterium GW2011_GWC2_35_8]OGJ05458.1 MAG: hypothetical protein A2238_01545 [Candidatus Nomurabacteria bacterium RIFOXYA2_FULL_35_9]OGJ14899.1 MAG: hypothetical protein A2554_00715 [Candidatus Nomurabacteria bacterium RIFOXYD2_FULL_35_12]